MQGITPSHLPPITTGFHVSTIQSREQPRRSWARFKKLLIDTPRDSNLLKRQKLWNFQKLNRGAFRSQIHSLPEIPYRVNNYLEHVTVGTNAQSADDSGQGIRIILPTIEREKPLEDSREEADVKTRDQATSPMHFDHENKDNLSADDADDESVDDPGYEFDYCVKRVDISTMTDKHHKKPQTRKHKSERKEARKKILKPRERTMTPDVKMETVRKNVTFADDDPAPNPKTPVPTLIDLEDAVVIEKVEIVDKSPRSMPSLERLPTADSVSSASSISMEVGDIGHTSQRSVDPLSIIDFLSGRVGDNRTLSVEHKGQRRSQKPFRERKVKERNISDTEADRIWFEKIVGDREVIDLKSYENFSRVRPSADSHSDSNNEVVTAGDVTVTRTHAKKSYTPRVTGEYPLTKGTNSNAKFYPVFSKDGTPIRKHGGTPPKTSRNIPGRRNAQGGKLYE